MANKVKEKTDGKVETVETVETNEPVESAGNPPAGKDTGGNTGGGKNSLELRVTREQVKNPHFVMLGKSEDGKFISAEAWNQAETVAVGAKTIEQILSETGVDLDNERFVITFSPNTGEVVAAIKK